MAGVGAAISGGTTGEGFQWRTVSDTGSRTQPFEAKGEAGRSMEFSEALIDAKLEAVEARTDTKFAQMMGELKLISQSIGDLSGKVSDVKNDVATVEGKVASVAAATAGVKWNILTTGLVLGGLIIAVAAFGVQILDTAQGLFSAGAATK